MFELLFPKQSLVHRMEYCGWIHFFRHNITGDLAFEGYDGGAALANSPGWDDTKQQLRAFASTGFEHSLFTNDVTTSDTEPCPASPDEMMYDFAIRSRVPRFLHLFDRRPDVKSRKDRIPVPYVPYANTFLSSLLFAPLRLPF